MFGRWFARHVASRYRKRGPDRTARHMIELATRHDVRGSTVLEIGGGVGEIGIELLKLGAVRVVNLELSPAYDEDAHALLSEAGLTDRVERLLVDIAVDPDAVAAADIVVMHRVVCCYPDYVRLLGAAADHARRGLVFSFPRHNPASRALASMQNLVFRLRRNEFRLFAHPPLRMLEVLAEHGLRPTVAEGGLVWQITALER
jgi:magnesium-protoporphyrin O-methyltransferase